MTSYSIRYSKKAKHLRLSVSVLKGVEVVVPDYVDKVRAQKMADRLIQDKQDWLKNTLKRLNISPESKPSLSLVLPEKLDLKALDQVLSITYQQENSEWLTIEDMSKGVLVVKGDLQNKALVLKCLEDYLKQLAKSFLVPRLLFFSENFDLKVNKVTIRGQKTRWGSCSSKKNISLNYKLLFIEKQLADYVLLHELAHTQCLNHSAAFWAILEKLCSNCVELDKRLNEAGNEIPGWVLKLTQI